MASYRTIAPTELARRLAAGDAPRVLDIREPYEWAIARIEGAELMPLSQVAAWWRTLDPDAELVVVCHHGRRSSALCRALAAEGFTGLIDLEGGIEAWRQAVDPTMPGY